MLRDNVGGRRRSPRNVLGDPLDICSIKPMAGFYRDGCCNTGPEDVGSHTVCAVMTSAFLEFSKSHGNDLSSSPSCWARASMSGNRTINHVANVAAKETAIAIGLPVTPNFKNSVLNPRSGLTGRVLRTPERP